MSKPSPFHRRPRPPFAVKPHFAVVPQSTLQLGEAGNSQLDRAWKSPQSLRMPSDRSRPNDRPRLDGDHLRVGRIHRALVIGLIAFVVGQSRLEAVKRDDQPSLAASKWAAAHSQFAWLEKLGLPDVRGARLVRDGQMRMTQTGGESLGLTWLFPPDNTTSARAIRGQVNDIEVRLWGHLAMMHRSGQSDPNQSTSALPLPSLEGDFCNTIQAVAMVQTKLRGKKSQAARTEQPSVSQAEAEAFLLAGHFHRCGREEPARQILQALGTSEGRMQALADHAGRMVVQAKANALVRQHVGEPNWPELATALGKLLAVVPASWPDRSQLERLTALADTRGAHVFGDDDRYAHLSERERELVNRLASELPAWHSFRNSLWIACEWGGVDDPGRRPEGALGEVLMQGPASLTMLAACLGDQRPIPLTHEMMNGRQAVAAPSMPMLVTMDEMVRALLNDQVPRGDLPQSSDDIEKTIGLRQWCLRAAGQSRLALAKRFLEAGDRDRRVEVAEWLALRESSGRGIEIVREWLPRQQDDWMRVQGFLLLYDALGRHGSKLKDLLADIRPRLLAMEEPVDVAQRAIGHAWEVRRELAVLDRMAATSQPLDGILAVIAEGGIGTTRCVERLPRLFLHTPPENNIAAVLAALPRFRWACEAERVLASLRRSGGTAERARGGLQRRRPPVALVGLSEAWATAFSDERELFTCLPQFSATLGEAAASACLAIHGPENWPRHPDFPMLREVGHRSELLDRAHALLRGELERREPEPLIDRRTFSPVPREIPPTFVLGRFVALPATERTAFLKQLPAEDQAVLRTFLAAPHSLQGAIALPASVRAELCDSARTIRVLAPSEGSHPLARLEGRRLTDETLAEILQATADSLAQGRNDVTSLRLNDTLDGVTLVSRPLDLAAMAMEVASHGVGPAMWITQWLHDGTIGPEAERMDVDQRRILVVSLVSPGAEFLTYPVALTKRLLDKNLQPPVVAENDPANTASAAESNFVRCDVGNGTEPMGRLLLWRNLRALLNPNPPAVEVPPGAPMPPHFIPCEGIVLWSFDPVAMRAALAKP